MICKEWPHIHRRVGRDDGMWGMWWITEQRAINIFDVYDDRTNKLKSNNKDDMKLIMRETDRQTDR